MIEALERSHTSGSNMNQSAPGLAEEVIIQLLSALCHTVETNLELC